ncbi:patatin-like phospholipase family protein [Dyella sp. ASV21]|jgi:predicted acylesterase/phospholipase RssA|uniref:patatin-like phospholipase family protein n=1 Tax=Dyella sp. ASV21 TaxID=2795114 RepID=UPI0018EE3658|nr:patatin-like phospholipase family protein [Dyella sp. ASV21]
MRIAALLLLAMAALTGCAGAPRQPAPPRLISGAMPEGYDTTVRLLASDMEQFVKRSPEFFQGIRNSATGGSLDILAISGGGSGGAFGVGALTGLSRAHARPRYALVTGVSVGALMAPFAYLGSDWDDAMQQALGGDKTTALLHSPKRTLFARLLVPLGFHHGPLFQLVDSFVTPAMIQAVARENAKGRRLLVATTDIDKQETMLWDMGAIATLGGERARETFRDVLVASASVPGMFPPVLMHVTDGVHHYDEMHVDGSVTAAVFTTPLIAELHPETLSSLRGAHIYMIVNGQMHRFPKSTPVKTINILTNSFGAGLVYKTREAVAETIALARQLDMQFEMTLIPMDYPMGTFIDFHPQTMRALFDYAADCAARGRLWVTPEQGLRRNLMARSMPVKGPPSCPMDDPDIGDGKPLERTQP